MTFGDYVYPKWSEAMGLCISFSSMIWVVAYAIYFLATTPGSLKERWRVAITPVSDIKPEAAKIPVSAVNSTSVEEIPLKLAEDSETQNIA